jgi:hypothetical protein
MTAAAKRKNLEFEDYCIKMGDRVGKFVGSTVAYILLWCIWYALCFALASTPGWKTRPAHVAPRILIFDTVLPYFFPLEGRHRTRKEANPLTDHLIHAA